MSKPTKFQGNVWVITDEKGALIDDIDTDMIYHNAHLAVTDIKEMGKFAFGNLTGWKDFAKKVKPNDIVICGKNFGSGSSRQHAVDCFVSLGVAALIAESFGAIYKRNAINAGFPILECPDMSRILAGGTPIVSGQNVEMDLAAGEIRDAATHQLLVQTQPFSKVQMDIYQAGNVFEFGRTL